MGDFWLLQKGRYKQYQLTSISSLEGSEKIQVNCMINGKMDKPYLLNTKQRPKGIKTCIYKTIIDKNIQSKATRCYYWWYIMWDTFREMFRDGDGRILHCKLNIT